MRLRPEPTDFTRAEWRIVASLNTPARVQRYLTRMPYNWEKKGATLRSFRDVVSRNEAHCLEAALAAAVILEQHGYPPLLLDLESQDKLDHVVFIYRAHGLWGSIARSRDTGLHGRKPVFRTIRQLVSSYFDPYVDSSARIMGYGVANLAELGNYNWRFSRRNVRKVERFLVEMPHKPFRSSQKRYEQLLRRYEAFKRRQRGKSPVYFSNRDTWMM